MRSGPAPLTSALLAKYAFGGDETSFFKTSSIWRRRDDTWFFEYAFGVDETLGGECRFLKMCVLRRRDTI